jgi:hypothetical protein
MPHAISCLFPPQTWNNFSASALSSSIGLGLPFPDPGKTKYRIPLVVPPLRASDQSPRRSARAIEPSPILSAGPVSAKIAGELFPFCRLTNESHPIAGFAASLRLESTVPILFTAHAQLRMRPSENPLENLVFGTSRVRLRTLTILTSLTSTRLRRSLSSHSIPAGNFSGMYYFLRRGDPNPGLERGITRDSGLHNRWA